MRRIVNFVALLICFILFVGLFGWAQSSLAATYYVKNGGNDSLDGLSDAAAWATTGKVQATVKDGDTVYFRSQDTWDAVTGARVLKAKTGVTYDGSTYGSGKRARFRAAGDDSMSSGIGVVSIPVSNVVFRGFEVDGNGFALDGINVGMYDATGDFGNVTIDNVEVHNTGDTNFYPIPPASVTVTNDASYHYFNKSGGIDWTTIPRLAQGNYGNAGSWVIWSGLTGSLAVLNGRWLAAESVTANQIKVPNGYIPGTLSGTQTVSGQSHYDTWGYAIIVSSTNEPGITVSNINIINSHVHHVMHEGITIYQSRLHPGNRTNGVLIRNNEVDHTGSTSQYGSCGIAINNDSDNVTAEFNYIHDNNSAVSIRTSPIYEIPEGNGAPENMIIRYNLMLENFEGVQMSNPQGENTAVWYQRNNKDFSQSLDFYGNIVTSTLVGCPEYYWDSSLFNISQAWWNNSVIKIYNNTFLETGSTCTNSRPIFGLAVWGSGSPVGWAGNPTIEFKNNIIYAGRNHGQGIDTFNDFAILDHYEGHNSVEVVSYSNNLIWVEGGVAPQAVRYHGNSYSLGNLSAWDPTAKNTDPNFIGGGLPTGFTGTYGTNMKPNTNFFAVNSGNAIDNGATLGSPYNGSINGASRPLGAGYDIGAYEYVPGQDTSPPASPSGLAVE